MVAATSMRISGGSRLAMNRWVRTPLAHAMLLLQSACYLKRYVTATGVTAAIRPLHWLVSWRFSILARRQQLKPRAVPQDGNEPPDLT